MNRTKISFRNAQGQKTTSFSARIALINWYCDEVIHCKQDETAIQVADEHNAFVKQLIAAIERHCGWTPRIDRDHSHEEQLLFLLRFLAQKGVITDLVIS